MQISAVAADGEDQVFGMPTAWGLGYGIGQFDATADEARDVFGVGGVGGSHAYADRATGTTFALTKNRLAQDFDSARAVAAVVADAR